jgi:hypothetical protein
MIFQPWVYLAIAAVCIAVFLLGVFASRLKEWLHKRRMAYRISKMPPRGPAPILSDRDRKKLSKYIGQGHSFDESLGYAKANCEGYREFVDHFDDLFLALK